MSEIKPSTPEGFERFRAALSDSPPKEAKADTLTPPQHWTTQIYEDEYKPLPRWIKSAIRYGILLLAFFIAVNHGSRHVRSSLCQWGWQNFCEMEQVRSE